MSFPMGLDRFELAIGDSGYPELLSQIPDAPRRLYGIGNPTALVPGVAIVGRSGAVISEHPWGTVPQRWTFRTRNRIIAGLSVAVLVLEASVGSGTFSTAEYADDAGRDVLAVPGSIFAPECSGANRLIRQGAVPITEADDLRCALEPVLGPPAVAADRLELAGEDEDPLLAAVRTNPLRPDDAARALGWDIVTVTRRLGMLEAAGSVTRYRDGRYGMAR